MKLAKLNFALTFFTILLSAQVHPPAFVGPKGFGATEFEISWSLRMSATGYEVAIAPASSPNNFNIITIDGKTNSYKFLQLNPCTEYIAMVRSVMAAEKSSWLNLQIQTGSGQPTPATSATLTNSELLIVDTGKRPICAEYVYLIEIYDDATKTLQSTQRTRQKAYTVDSLTPNVDYLVKVYVEDLLTGSKSTSVEATGKGNATPKPPAPLGVIITATDKESVTLSWTSDAKLVRYGIDVVKRSDLSQAGNEVIGTTNSGTFTGLTECTLYSATVRGYTGANPTDNGLRSLDIPFVTDGDETKIKPNLAVSVQDLMSKNTRVVITDSGVSVSCISVGYNVELRSNNILIYKLSSVVNKEFYLKNLTPETEYSLTVAPVILKSSKELTADAKSIKFTTLKEVKKYDVAVENVQVSSISKNYAILSWDRLLPKPKAYLVTVTDTSGRMKYLTVPENAILINGLEICSKYVVNVYPIEDGNENNIGKQSSDIAVTTTDTAVSPISSVSLTKTSATALEYNIFEPTLVTCGQRRYYYILSDLETKEELARNVAISKTGSIAFQIYPGKFILSVYAFVNDERNKSPIVVSSALVEPAVKSLDAITEFKKKVSDQSSITLTWKPVKDAVKYQVSAVNKLNKKYVAKQETTKTELIFSSLKMCSVYTFYIRAFAADGSLSPVNVLDDAETIGQNPLPIISATLYALSATKIGIVIRDQEIFRCPSAKYSIDFYDSRVIDKPAITVQTQDKVSVANNFKPSTTYYAMIQVTGKYSGSESLKVKTNDVTTSASGAKEVEIPKPVFPRNLSYYIKLPLVAPDNTAYLPNNSIDYCPKLVRYMNAGGLTVLECNLIRFDKNALVAYVKFGTKDDYIGPAKLKYACLKANQRLFPAELENIGFMVEFQLAVISKDLI